MYAVATSLRVLSLRSRPSAFTRLTHARVNFPAMCAALQVLPQNCDAQFNPPCSSLGLFIDAVLSAGFLVWVLHLVDYNKGRNEGDSASFEFWDGAVVLSGECLPALRRIELETSSGSNCQTTGSSSPTAVPSCPRGKRNSITSQKT